MNDETMDELATEPRYVPNPEGDKIVELQAETQPHRSIVACLFCGDFVPGLTVAESAEDAHNLGWQRVAPSGAWRCADCLIEEAAF